MASVRGVAFVSKFKTPKVNIKGNTEKQNAAARRAVIRGTQRGILRAETTLSRALDQAMESSTWGPFSPKFPYARKNGQIVGAGYRDLIDTGELKNSKVVKSKFLQTSANIEVYYTSAYANLVHFGGAIRPYGNRKAATVILPARPWIKAVLEGGIGSIPKVDIAGELDRSIAEAWAEAFG